MIDERSRRRADWVEGVPILLEDGQVWHFPKPIVGFRLAIRDGRAEGDLSPAKPTRETSTRFGSRFDELHDAVILAAREAAEPNCEGAEGEEARQERRRQAEADTQRKRIQAMLNLAGDLLVRNYTLSDDELSDLLPIYPDRENADIWSAIWGVASGTAGPKQRPDGGGSSPS